MKRYKWKPPKDLGLCLCGRPGVDYKKGGARCARCRELERDMDGWHEFKKIDYHPEEMAEPPPPPPEPEPMPGPMGLLIQGVFRTYAF